MNSDNLVSIKIVTESDRTFIMEIDLSKDYKDDIGLYDLLESKKSDFIYSADGKKAVSKKLIESVEVVNSLVFKSKFFK